MNRWMSVFVAVVVVMSLAVTVQAQCCKGKMGGAAAKMDISSCPVLSKLNLTGEQKVQVQALCDKCNEAGCTQEAWGQMVKELETVLTPEQLTTFKANCEEMKAKGMCGVKTGKSSCSMKQSEKSVEEMK